MASKGKKRKISEDSPCSDAVPVAGDQEGHDEEPPSHVHPSTGHSSHASGGGDTEGYAEPTSHVSPSTSGHTAHASGDTGSEGPVEPWNIRDTAPPFSIYRKLEEGVVLIDSLTEMPRRAYFLKSHPPKQEVKREEYFKVHYNDDRDAPSEDHFIIPGQSGEWKKRDEPATNEKMVREIFDHVKSCVTWSTAEKPNKWVQSCPGNKHVEMVYEMLKSECSHLACVYRGGLLPEALIHRMGNAAGKSALKSILTMAGIIVFGVEAEKAGLWGCIAQGYSNSEKFPVAQTPTSLYYRGMGSRSSRSRSRSGSEQSSSNRSRSRSSGRGTASEPTVRDTSPVVITIPTSVCRTDVVMFSQLKPEWPHILFVGELKYGGMSDHDISKGQMQLLRQMFGAMLIQDTVFGILMSDEEAHLFTMKMHCKERLICVYTRHYLLRALYEFAPGEMYRLFSDVMGALRFMAKVNAVCHWSVPEFS